MDTSTPRIHRVFAVALTLGLSLTGITLTSASAHAATVTANYVSSADGVTTSEVEATLIDELTDLFSSGWYYCDSELNANNFIFSSGDANIILGDNCDWAIDAISLETGSLSIWSQTANLGKLTALSSNGPGIRVRGATSLTINGGSVTAQGSLGGAGIGHGIINANGPITIQWRANVNAIGGAAVGSYGAGAGIGGGGSNNTTGQGGQGITINTSGLVTATGGAGSGAATAGANIGTGGTYGGPVGTPTHPTVTVTPPVHTPAGTGTSMMFDGRLNLVSSALINNVSRESAVTYLAQPAPGYKVSSALTPDGNITSRGNNLYSFTPLGGPPAQQVTAYFTFAQIPTALTLSATPSSPQTYPGSVTLSSTFTDAGVPIANIPVVFTVNNLPQTAVITDNNGVATLTLTSPAPGTYNFGASFAGNANHPATTAIALYGYLVLATQPSFAIEVPSATDTVYGNEPFALTTSGKLSVGDVTWSVPDSNGIAAIDPATGKLTMLAAGTVTVTAEAPADASHAAAIATRTITIAPRPVTVRPDAQSVQFGDDAELTWTATPPLIAGDSLTGSLKLAAPPQIGENQIIEDEAFANPNYAVHFEAGVLTIAANEAQQNVIDEIKLLPSPIISLGQADSVAIVTLALEALSEEEQPALPQQVLDRLETAQAEAAVVNHSDVAAGVSASSQTLPWNIRLVVRDASTLETNAFAAQLDNNRTLLAINDIHFVDTLSNTVWQPPIGSPVEISLTQVQLDGYSDIQVHHQLVSGSLETVASQLDGAVVRFEGASFSLYGVSGLANDNLPNTGSDGDTSLVRLAGLAALFVGAAAFLIAATRKRSVRR